MVASREERWLASRLEREQAQTSHPFSRQLPQEPGTFVFDDGADEDVVLVAFSGAADKLGIPAVEFFEAVVEPCRRVYVRGLAVPFEAHALGTTAAEVRDSLAKLVGDTPRVVFAGSSFGGFQAMLYGTLLGVESVFAVNPTTTLRPELVTSWDDHRWDPVIGALTPDFVEPYGDLPTLWQLHSAPPVTVHFSYRDDVLRRHAEHIAECDNVTLFPHYELAPMDKISADGTLAATLSGLLRT
jgi:hypothetical protein